MRSFEYEINGVVYRVEIIEVTSSQARVIVNGIEYLVKFTNSHNPGLHAVKTSVNPGLSAVPPVAGAVNIERNKQASAAPRHSGGLTITAPIPGVVHNVPVKPGDAVKSGDVVAVIEAMKMENNIYASRDGKVKEVLVHAGSEVQEGDVLLTLTE